MLVEPENGGPFFRIITADSFEPAGTVVYDMGEDVNIRLVPVDHLPVHPDFFYRRDCHKPFPL